MLRILRNLHFLYVFICLDSVPIWKGTSMETLCEALAVLLSFCLRSRYEVLVDGVAKSIKAENLSLAVLSLLRMGRSWKSIRSVLVGCFFARDMSPKG